MPKFRVFLVVAEANGATSDFSDESTKPEIMRIIILFFAGGDERAQRHHEPRAAAQEAQAGEQGVQVVPLAPRADQRRAQPLWYDFAPRPGFKIF